MHSTKNGVHVFRGVHVFSRVHVARSFVFV
jgi:hypothetical protein